MNKTIYVTANGASENMKAQAIKANNIANATTPGFRSQFVIQQSVKLPGDGVLQPSFVKLASPGNDFSAGTLTKTDNPLHVAINADGWFAVQTQDGQEAYTRRGDLRVNSEGQLINGSGLLMLNSGGAPITLPPASSISISPQGKISVIPLSGNQTNPVMVDQLKLTKPEHNALFMRDDGLFQMLNGSQADLDPMVSLTSGFFETSNVNPIAELLDLISLARKHELDVKMMRKLEDNAQAGQKLMQFN